MLKFRLDDKKRKIAGVLLAGMVLAAGVPASAAAEVQSSASVQTGFVYVDSTVSSLVAGGYLLPGSDGSMFTISFTDKSYDDKAADKTKTGDPNGSRTREVLTLTVTSQSGKLDSNHSIHIDEKTNTDGTAIKIPNTITTGTASYSMAADNMSYTAVYQYADLNLPQGGTAQRNHYIYYDTGAISSYSNAKIEIKVETYSLQASYTESTNKNLNDLTAYQAYPGRSTTSNAKKMQSFRLMTFFDEEGNETNGTSSDSIQMTSSDIIATSSDSLMPVSGSSVRSASSIAGTDADEKTRQEKTEASVAKAEGLSEQGADILYTILYGTDDEKTALDIPSWIYEIQNCSASMTDLTDTSSLNDTVNKAYDTESEKIYEITKTLADTAEAVVDAEDKGNEEKKADKEPFERVRAELLLTESTKLTDADDAFGEDLASFLDGFYRNDTDEYKESANAVRDAWEVYKNDASEENRNAVSNALASIAETGAFWPDTAGDEIEWDLYTERIGKIQATYSTVVTAEETEPEEALVDEPQEDPKNTLKEEKERSVADEQTGEAPKPEAFATETETVAG